MLPKPRFLHEVDSGRLFVRHGDEGAMMMVGVVQVPDDIEFERKHPARLNSSFWLDTVTSREVRLGFSNDNPLEAHSISELVGSKDWARGRLPDALEVFVRRTGLPGAEAGKVWALVAGVSDRPLLPEGLHDVAPDAQWQRLRMVDPYLHPADTLSDICRKPLWGNDSTGPCALGTDLTPEGAKLVADQRRSRLSSDPTLSAFIAEMERRSPQQAWYTAEALARRKRLIKKVILDVTTRQAKSTPSLASAF